MIGFEVFRKFFSSEEELRIFDVGAHHGESIAEFLDIFKNSIVFGFEPDPENFKYLEKRFSGCSRVSIRNAAVSHSTEGGLLHRNNYDATHSLLPIDENEINRWADASDFHEDEVLNVQQVTLDSFCAKEAITRIDILKLDIQGGELLAFQGANELLGAQAIECIFCEVEFRSLYKNQPLFWDITSHLRSVGYHFVNIVCPKVSEMGVLAWADAIYVKSALWQSIAQRHSAGKIIH